MGESASKRSLSQVTDRAASSCSLAAVSGRFHRLPRKFEDDYVKLDSVLGSGYNGQVFLVRSNADEATKYAAKSLRLIGINAQKKEELENEVEIFLTMDHPHVARLWDCYEGDSQVVLVMELCAGGELFKRVQKLKKFSENDAVEASWQMLLAVSYIHSHKITHRDIKPQNFLYDKHDSNQLKLIDFGFSKVSPPDAKMHAACGTMSYIAPEVLDQNYTSQCDMWSLGVTVFVLLFGYMPFSGGQGQQMTKIRLGEYKKKPDVWSKVSRAAQSFVEKLLVVDPAKRMTAEQALTHEWIAKKEQRSLEQPDIDQSVAEALVQFGQESHFRRACMCVMSWSLTSDERQPLHDAFIELDTDRSGAISLVEFKKVLEDKFHIDDEHARAAFDALDTNHNNEIHYSEFLAAMVSTRVRMHDELLRETFRRFDVDKHGYITKDDLQKVLGEVYDQKEMDALMEEVEVPADGKIDYEAFIHFVKHSSEPHHHDAANKLIDHAHKHPDHSHKRNLRMKSTVDPAPEEKLKTDDEPKASPQCGQCCQM